VKILAFVLKVLELLLRNGIFTIRTGLAKGLKRRYGFGVKPRFSLTDEERFLMKLDFQGKTVFDVGAYVGIFTMFFARAVGRTGKVIAFEPNPRNYDELAYNVKLNDLDNVTIMKIGLGRGNEQMALAVDPIFPARGTLEKDRKGRMLRKGGARSVAIEVSSLDSLMETMKLPRPDFVKLDVEGFEMDVLYGMVETINNCKPNLLVELPNREILVKIIEFLLSKRYSIYHIKSGTEIASLDSPVVKEGHHVFCK